MINVSVIVPVYNTGRYLKRCLDSLVNQTLKELEVILIDDGSTDDSFMLMKEYETAYPDMVKAFTKENGGQASARNLGILKSSGRYIGFVDSDDYVDVKMYETMYKAAKKGRYDMVECHYHYLCEERKRTKEYRPRGDIRQFKNRKDMFINPQVSPCNKLYRREVFMHAGVDFPEGFVYEDTAFYIKAIPFIRREHYVNERFYYYFLRSGSTMNAIQSRKVGNIFPVLSGILDFYKKNHFYETYREELEYFCVKILLCSSLSRIGRIKDYRRVRQLCDMTFSYISDNFPGYKKNRYLHGKIGIYIKLVNQSNSRYIGKILGHMRRG